MTTSTTPLTTTASPRPAAPTRAVIFDLDGTLADTLVDIAAAGNHTLEAFGREPRPVDDYRYLLGRGLRQTIIGAFGGEDPKDVDVDVDAALETFRDFYQDHMLDHTAPYAGVVELLDELRRRGLALAVLSNKHQDATAEITRQLFSPDRFEVVRGQRPDTPRKPDPAPALAVLSDLGVEPQACVYVGDMWIDMLTGKRTGMFTVGVLWGLRGEKELRDHGADAIIAHPSELLTLLR